MTFEQLVPPGSSADPQAGSHLESPAFTGGSFLFEPRDMGYDMLGAAEAQPDEGQYVWWGADLPPKDSWVIDPWQQKLETPVDQFNRVDVPKLVALGRSAVSEKHEWDTTETRIDHLYWSQTAYEKLAHQIGDGLPVTFRNLPPNKIVLPLQFERWKHHLVIPSDFPSLEVMSLSVEAWVSAKNLYGQIHAAVVWERRRRDRIRGLDTGNCRSIPRQGQEHNFEDFYVDTLAAHHRGVAHELTIHQSLPKVFQLINVESSAKEVLKQIGYEVRNRCRDGMTGRHVNFKSKAARAA